MKVHVSHSREKQTVAGILDQPLKVLFAQAVNGLEIADERRVWTDFTMAFSFIGRVGFISLPVSGEMEIVEEAVIVTVELPPVVKMLVGEDRIRAGLQKEILALITRS